jgi:hypothetical protein
VSIKGALVDAHLTLNTALRVSLHYEFARQIGLH